MSSDRERKRGKGGEEAAARRTKRPRLQDEDRTSSEREMALHPSEDEDIFSLAALTEKETHEGTFKAIHTYIVTSKKRTRPI